MNRRRYLSNTVFYLILIALAVIFLLPVYLMLLTGLKPINQVDLKTMWSLPIGGLHIDNFIAGFRQLAPNLRNSLVMVIPGPDMVLVQGDTTTTFCGALAGFYCGVPVGHVEAGLRTWDLHQPFPEEMNRVLATRITALRARGFAATSSAVSEP